VRLTVVFARTVFLGLAGGEGENVLGFWGVNKKSQKRVHDRSNKRYDSINAVTNSI